MDDSPLSIVANITGILTFVVAITAFVYIRYNIIKNGEREMLAALHSISRSLEEMRSLAEVQKIHPADDPDAVRQSRMISDLYAVELSIILLVMKAHGTSDMSFLESKLSSLFTHDAAWADTAREVEEHLAHQNQLQNEECRNGMIIRLIRRISPALLETGAIADTFLCETAFVVWATIRLLMRLGETPTLVRWYMVREEVQEKMKEREAFRSKILLHQAINYAAQMSKHERHLHSLMTQYQTVENHLRKLEAQEQEGLPASRPSDGDSVSSEF